PGLYSARPRANVAGAFARLYHGGALARFTYRKPAAPPRPAQHTERAARAGDDLYLLRHSGRVGAELPRPGRAAADAGVGQYDLGGGAVSPQRRPLDDARASAGARPHRAQPQPLRRRAARQTRPAERRPRRAPMIPAPRFRRPSPPQRSAL